MSQAYLSFGDHAWFDSNADKVGQDYAHSVGQKKPDPWGLYDMHGNAWEWCSDWYGEDYYSNSPSVDPQGPPSGDVPDVRCTRGGSWYAREHKLRCSERESFFQDIGNREIGFRVVRSQ